MHAPQGAGHTPLRNVDGDRRETSFGTDANSRAVSLVVSMLNLRAIRAVRATKPLTHKAVRASARDLVEESGGVVKFENVGELLSTSMSTSLTRRRSTPLPSFLGDWTSKQAFTDWRVFEYFARSNPSHQRIA